MEDITEGKIRRLRNLKLYQGKSDAEILEMLANRKATIKTKTKSEKEYDERFNDKVEMLQQEFGLDMNTANDIEMVHNLVRQMLQAESIDQDIRTIQDKEDKTKDDVLTLKALGDFQRNLQMTIADLQDKLGISRKIRKEKSTDDIPQFIDNLLYKAKDFWQRKTLFIECPKCKIELVRYWINFPDLVTTASFVSECPQCGEKVTYNT